MAISKLILDYFHRMKISFTKEKNLLETYYYLLKIFECLNMVEIISEAV